MNNLKLFGKRIRELRKLNNFTQEQLAELVGLEYKHVGNIENGNFFTKMSTLEKFALAFNCEIKELFDFNHIKEKNEIIKEITSLLAEAPEDKIRFLYRITKDVLK